MIIKKNAEVGMIGLGAMGSALAQALLDSNVRVSVWNRSPEKSDALARQGAVACQNPKEVISKSELTIICLSNYDAWSETVVSSNLQEALCETTLVQLTTGSLSEVEEHAALMTDLGAELIEGSILCFPEHIGTDMASIVVSGKPESINSYKAILELMSPKLSYLGTKPTAPVILGNAIMSSVLGFSAGLINGAALCVKEDLPLEALKEQTIHNFTRMQTEPLRILNAIINQDTETTQASVSTWYAAHTKLLEMSKMLAIDDSFHKGLNDMFKKTVDHGMGNHDISAMVDVFTNKS